ncbi:MAG TPA: ornithine cyclodeaminase family protein [Stellaceae bacterium]|nr:ornithine cyclodeaminase family protein [Stellaceae bacterium]
MLKASDVAPLLDLTKAMALTEDVFSELARGQVDIHSPYHLFVREGALRVVSGALKESGFMGVRCGPTQGPPEAHVALLYANAGPLLAVMGYPFGTLRTAATVAVSLKRMARPDARRLGMIGTGNNAAGLLRAARTVRDVTEIVVFSRDAERRRRFCEEASRTVGIPVRPVETMRQAVSGMDIVLTSTSNRSPLFPLEWLDKGTHLTSMGPISELDPGILLGVDRLVVSSKVQEENYYLKMPPFPLIELIAAGKLTWDRVAELGDVVTGNRPGRASADEITVFHESQGGFGDVVFAAWVYAEAKRRSLGVEFSF